MTTPGFHWRTLATALGYLAREMSKRNHARISVPQTNRHHALVGFDVFSCEQVEEMQLEAERLARLAEDPALPASLEPRPEGIARLCKLAEEGAGTRHEEAFYMEDDYDEADVADGHTRIFATCSHPDCLLVRSELLTSLDGGERPTTKVLGTFVYRKNANGEIEQTYEPAVPIDPPAPSGISLIAQERERQIQREGWTPEHDDAHVSGELATAAICYAMICDPDGAGECAFDNWPFEPSSWKPSTEIRNLAKAGALIAAEIDRLQRRSSSPVDPNGASK